MKAVGVMGGTLPITAVMTLHSRAVIGQVPAATRPVVLGHVGAAAVGLVVVHAVGPARANLLGAVITASIEGTAVNMVVDVIAPARDGAIEVLICRAIRIVIGRAIGRRDLARWVFGGAAQGARR